MTSVTQIPPADSIVEEVLDCIGGVIAKHIGFILNRSQLGSILGKFRQIVGRACGPDFSAANKIDQVLFLMGGICVMFDVELTLEPKVLTGLRRQLEALLGQ